MQTLESAWFARATEEERAAAAATVDLDAEEIACPACGASFSKQGRCPACGLNFGFG